MGSAQLSPRSAPHTTSLGPRQRCTSIAALTHSGKQHAHLPERLLDQQALLRDSTLGQQARHKARLEAATCFVARTRAMFDRALMPNRSTTGQRPPRSRSSTSSQRKVPSVRARGASGSATPVRFSATAPTTRITAVITHRDRRRDIAPSPRASQPVPGLSREKASTFGEFAGRWLERQMLEGGRLGSGLAEKSRKDIEWRLSKHLLPTFGPTPLPGITVEAVDAFRLEMVRKGKLSATSINKLLFTLSAIMEVAVEYELIARNPARGRRRRLNAPPAQRTWLDRADHISALLDAAGRLDRRATVLPGQRRAILATLCFSGLRIGEALALRWKDIDLDRGTIQVLASKTQAGLRTVNLLEVLRDELSDYQSLCPADPDGRVFGTSAGRENGATNVRRRILAKAVELANTQLAERDAEPLPEGLTPHALRRTFASLLFAIGEPPPYVMAQMGHTTPHLTLSIYARQMNRRDGETERLKALLAGRRITSHS
jgi:integrase